MLVTLESLLEKKDSEIEQKKTYHSEFLGGEVEVKRIPRKKFFSILEEAGNDYEGNFLANCRLIYEACDLFHAKELTAGEVEPWDAVVKIFEKNIAEANRIGEFITSFYMGEEEEKK